MCQGLYVASTCWSCPSKVFGSTLLLLLWNFGVLNRGRQYLRWEEKAGGGVFGSGGWWGWEVMTVTRDTSEKCMFQSKFSSVNMFSGPEPGRPSWQERVMKDAMFVKLYGCPGEAWAGRSWILENPLPAKRNNGEGPYCSLLSIQLSLVIMSQLSLVQTFLHAGFIKGLPAGSGPGPALDRASSFLAPSPVPWIKLAFSASIWVLIATYHGSGICVLFWVCSKSHRASENALEDSLHLFYQHFHYFSIWNSSLSVF